VRCLIGHGGKVVSLMASLQLGHLASANRRAQTCAAIVPLGECTWGRMGFVWCGWLSMKQRPAWGPLHSNPAVPSRPPRKSGGLFVNPARSLAPRHLPLPALTFSCAQGCSRPWRGPSPPEFAGHNRSIFFQPDERTRVFTMPTRHRRKNWQRWVKRHGVTAARRDVVLGPRMAGSWQSCAGRKGLVMIAIGPAYIS
jgi:hypothetical protein